MDDKPSYYAIIPATVRYDERLNPNAKLLYGELTCLSNKEGYCWASNGYFAEIYDKDERTIRRWLNELKNYGYIKCVYKNDDDNKTQRYIYIIDRFMPVVNIEEDDKSFNF